jgi:hypothetical protein
MARYCRDTHARGGCFGSFRIVFHRAFHLVPDLIKALEQLIDLGVTSVMADATTNSLPGCSTPHAAASPSCRRAASGLRTSGGLSSEPAAFKSTVRSSG